MNTPHAILTLVSSLPAWPLVCGDVDTHLHYTREVGNLTAEGHAIYDRVHTYLPHATRGELIYTAACAWEWTCFLTDCVTMDIMLVTEKRFYGTKGISLDEITPNHYQVTELQPYGLLIFLAGLNSLTVTVIGNCVVIEDDALSNSNGLTPRHTG